MAKHQQATTGEVIDDGKPDPAAALAADEMHVKVHAPYKVYFDGVATSVSAVNDTGPFDILAKHHNFMTLINEGEIIVRTKNSEERIPVSRGVMHVKANKVVVFLDV